MTVDEHDSYLDWFDDTPDVCQVCLATVDFRALRQPNVPYTDELFCDVCASEIEERYGNESFLR